MKSYIIEEVKWDAMFITLNRLFFNKELEKSTIVMLPSKKEMDANIFNNIIFVNNQSEMLEAELIGYMLFEMCQIKAFSIDTDDRHEITYMLADELDRCGFYAESKRILIEERFTEGSSEYKDLREEFVFTLNDLKQSLDNLEI